MMNLCANELSSVQGARVSCLLCRIDGSFLCLGLITLESLVQFFVLSTVTWITGTFIQC
jgi:hypothetical protein